MDPITLIVFKNKLSIVHFCYKKLFLKGVLPIFHVKKNLKKVIIKYLLPVIYIYIFETFTYDRSNLSLYQNDYSAQCLIVNTRENAHGP